MAGSLSYDVARSKQEYVDGIMEDLNWLGLTWDELYFQSDRVQMYERAKEQMIANKRLYPCFESQEELELKKKTLLARNMPPIYDRTALELTGEEIENYKKNGQNPHYRFYLENKEINWHDGVRGDVHFSPKNISDPILIRADGTMTYMIASVVDDIDLNITHIIRGEDHITNSAIHTQMFAALNAKCPEFSHLSRVKSAEGEISKRYGGFDIRALRTAGFHPLAVLSFLAKLGTSDPIEFRRSHAELVADFNISKFNKSPSTYHEDELKRLNEKLTHNLSYSEAKPLLEDTIDEDFWENVKPNLSFINEANEWYKIINEDISDVATDKELLAVALQTLPPMPWDIDTWNQWIEEIKKQSSKRGKELFMPLRLALTGMEHGPELKKILPLIGYNKTKERLSK
jgi:glutamyl-tRNA synthetase